MIAANSKIASRAETAIAVFCVRSGHVNAKQNINPAAALMNTRIMPGSSTQRLRYQQLRDIEPKSSVPIVITPTAEPRGSVMAE